MNQQINTKLIVGIIAGVIVILGFFVYRSVTAPPATPVVGGRKVTVAPPTQPSAEAIKKMREARNAH